MIISWHQLCKVFQNLQCSELAEHQHFTPEHTSVLCFVRLQAIRDVVILAHRVSESKKYSAAHVQNIFQNQKQKKGTKFQKENTMPRTIKATILVSGTGSNLQAIIDATKPGKPLHNLITIVKVFSDREKGKTGLARAEKEDIPTLLLPSKRFKDEYPKRDGEKMFDEVWRHKFDQELARRLLEDAPDMVVNAGFMHVYTDDFLA